MAQSYLQPMARLAPAWSGIVSDQIIDRGPQHVGDLFQGRGGARLLSRFDLGQESLRDAGGIGKSRLGQIALPAPEGEGSFCG